MRQKLRNRITVTALFTFTYFFYYLCRYNYPITLPFIKAEFAFTAAQMGAIATALTLGYALGQLVNGVLVDRKGPRLMMAVGGVGSVIANLFMGGSNTLTMFICGWLVNGYFQAMGWPSTLRLITNWFRQGERGKQMAIAEVGTSAAAMLILPLAAWLAGFSWRLAFAGPAVLLGVATIWYHLTARDYPEAALVEDARKRARLPLGREMLTRWKLVFGNWRLVAVNVSYGLCQFVRYAMITWIPLYLYETTGASIMSVAIKGTAFQLGGVVGSLFMGYVADLPFFRRRGWVLIVLWMVGAAAAAAAIGLAPPGVWTIVMLTLCGLGIESIEVVYFLIPPALLGDEMMATGGGCMNATGKLIASLQGVTLGYIIDLFGYGAAFGTAGVFSVLAAVLVIPLGFRCDYVGEKDDGR